jgi:SAM-dependent methyltransferase
MHPTSMSTMRLFVESYHLTEGCVIVDIGSYDYNGSYRPLFANGSSKYIGADIIPGPGVDVIVGSDAWNALKDVDAVISGQTFEHVEDVPLLLGQIKEILKPSGLLCIIAPSAGPPHDYPSWYRNFSIETMTGFITDAGFEVISCTIDKKSLWCDCCCIAIKPTVTVSSLDFD